MAFTSSPRRLSHFCRGISRSSRVDNLARRAVEPSIASEVIVSLIEIQHLEVGRQALTGKPVVVSIQLGRFAKTLILAVVGRPFVHAHVDVARENASDTSILSIGT